MCRYYKIAGDTVLEMVAGWADAIALGEKLHNKYVTLDSTTLLSTATWL